MNSRQRVLRALSHKEPDRVPYDLNGTHVTSIHVTAYRNLCEYLGIDHGPIEFADVIQQIVVPCDELLDHLGVDTRGLFPWVSHNRGFEAKVDKGDHFELVDEWGFTQQIKKDGGFWWSQVGCPLGGMAVDRQAMEEYRWPIADDPTRMKGIRERAELYRRQGKIVMCKSICAGMFEMGQRIRGMSDFLCDMLADPATAEKIMDNVLEMKKKFWTMMLDEMGDVIDIVVENDDYGTQKSQLISFDTYKALIEPRLRELIGFIKKKHAEKRLDDEPGYIFFHSCGNVRPYLPDFIDMGIDILNPVHVNAEGMEPKQLKREFGEQITFWGGGVETQNVLPNGTPEEVAADVKQNVEALMPGGGFVFNTVHNIQAEIPPANIMAMVDTLRNVGQYWE